MFQPYRECKKVTNFLAEEMGEFEEIDLCRPVSEKRSFSKEDVCFVGVPSYGGRVPEIAVERMVNFEGNGTKAIPVILYFLYALYSNLSKSCEKPESGNTFGSFRKNGASF